MNGEPEFERSYRALVSYDGQSFHGWQFQPALATVQGAIEDALHAVTGTRIRVDGAGRTDQGVHALGQVASFRIRTRLTPERLRLAVNFHLPPAVRLLRLEEAPAGFSARFSAHYRLYTYRLAREVTPFNAARAHTPRVWPDLERMNEALSFLLGEWDCYAFTVQSEGPFGCHLTEARWVSEPDALHLWIRSNRFLYRMVRIVVGVSLQVGIGKTEPSEFARALRERDRSIVKQVAPAEGLYLAAVGYDPPWPEERSDIPAPPYGAT